MNSQKTVGFDYLQSHGLIGLLCLSLVASFSVVMPRKNEPAAPEVVATSVYWNPLTLNGRPLDMSTFSILSRGVLSVVEENPAGGRTVRVPFRVYVRRTGEIVCGSPDGPGVMEVSVQPMLALARPGDELVIELVRPADRAVRRIIKLQSFNWMMNHLTSDGC